MRKLVARIRPDCFEDLIAILALYRSFVENVGALPITEKSLLVRSYFDYGRPRPTSEGRGRCTLVMQRIDRFLELHDARPYRDYWDVCTRDYL